MKSLAGSKRTAGTPFASPTKAGASAKRSRTRYDYYDGEDSESLPEDQWSAEADTGSEMSVDWDDGRASPCDRFVANTTTRGRSIFRREALTKEEPDCLSFTDGVNCRGGSTNTQKNVCVGCTCSKSGHQCSASSCCCQGGTACHNPFKKLDLGSLFGQDPVALHPCFMAWVVRQNKTSLERTSTESLFDLVFEMVYLLEEFHDKVIEPYLEWRSKWDQLSLSEQDGGNGLALKQQLLRMGLTSQEDQLIFFSFCHSDGWRETDHDWHCRDCGECMEWREWHCDGCNRCSYGLGLPCDNCGRGADGREDSEGTC